MAALARVSVWIVALVALCVGYATIHTLAVWCKGIAAVYSLVGGSSYQLHRPSNRPIVLLCVGRHDERIVGREQPKRLLVAHWVNCPTNACKCSRMPCEGLRYERSGMGAEGR